MSAWRSPRRRVKANEIKANVTVAHPHEIRRSAPGRGCRGRSVLPACVALTLPIGRQVLAWALFAFISVFALTNSLRMASIIAADQATARADRLTEGVRTADSALDMARAQRDEACGRGLGKTVACKIRQAEVIKVEAQQTQATAKVVAQANPESTDFAKLVGEAGAPSSRVPMTSRCCGCCSERCCLRWADSC
jgi:hypothetical protein